MSISYTFSTQTDTALKLTGKAPKFHAVLASYIK